jgi:hypothetical protein
MRDGLLFVSNGNGQKIVRYNSYGDLLFMIFNKDTNPPPLTLKPKDTHTANNNLSTRWSVEWPLLSPGVMSVDSRKHIYAADQIPAERHGYDVENRVLLDSMVLHFDSEGLFVDYLGQEGLGGTPFPHINGIFISQDDDVVVICRVNTSQFIYWFDKDSTLLYLLKINNSVLPLPNKEGVTYYASLDNIIAAPDAKQLYLKVDYYYEIYDESTGTMSGMGTDKSVIYTMNITDGKYDAKTEVPFFEYVTRNVGKKETENMLYMMFGAAKDGNVFLYFPVEEGFSFLMLQPKTGKQNTGILNISVEELEYCSLSVSEEGIVSALLAANYEAKFVWWRTDKLLADLLQE